MSYQMNAILKEYDNSKILLDNLDRTLLNLINSLLEQKSIRVHQVQTRVKDRDSLENKIIRKNDKYGSLSDITDIVGVRIITYFDDEVDQIAAMIEEEFVIDQDNSVDKRKIDNDKFGYRSLHYVANLKRDRINLPEYASCGERKFEFQIRTILQHSWAEIEHGLGYKGEFEIPSTAKRTFYRVAALLEQADIEFVKLKSTIEEYEKNVNAGVIENPSQIEVNKASLISFITKNENVIRIENEIASCRPSIYITEGEASLLINDSLINELKYLGANNIKEVEDLYLRYERNFIAQEQLDFTTGGACGFERGASILWLVNFLSNLYNNNEGLEIHIR